MLYGLFHIHKNSAWFDKYIRSLYDEVEALVRETTNRSNAESEKKPYNQNMNEIESR